MLRMSQYSVRRQAMQFGHYSHHSGHYGELKYRPECCIQGLQESYLVQGLATHVEQHRACPPASRFHGWEVTIAFRKINIVGRSSMAFGLRSIPRHPFLLRFAEVAAIALVGAGCIVQPSNPALRPSLELLRPAPLCCGEGKGHSEQCGRKKAARPQEISIQTA